MNPTICFTRFCETAVKYNLSQMDWLESVRQAVPAIARLFLERTYVIQRACLRGRTERCGRRQTKRLAYARFQSSVPVTDERPLFARRLPALASLRLSENPRQAIAAFPRWL